MQGRLILLIGSGSFSACWLLFKMPLSSGFVNELLAVSIGLEDFRDMFLLLFKFCIVGDDVFCSVE